MNIFSQPVPGFWSETLGQVDMLPLANRIGAYFFMCQDPNYEPYAKRHCQNIFSDYQLADEKPGIDSYVNPFTENLMQHVDGFDPTGRPPDITITVPVAINAEPLQGIENTITQIGKAAKTSGPVDVLVWANAKFNPKDARSQSKAMIEAEKNYENLQKLLSKHQTPNIRYITGLQVGPENVMRMSDIRFSYMSVLLVHARRGGYEPNHPVLWLTHLHFNPNNWR